MSKRIMRLFEVLELTGLSRSTIDRLEDGGIFPARRKIGVKSVGWIESEVCEWIERLAQRNAKNLQRAPKKGVAHE